MKARALVIAAIAAAIVGVSCAALFEDAAQCSSDTDCARFNAVCDVGTRVCVSRELVAELDAGEDTFVPPTDAPADTFEEERCDLPNKPVETIMATSVDAGDEAGISSEITTSMTLGCTTDWLLRGRVFVRAGATLTIRAGTTIRAERGTNAGLVILPGAKIVASGTAAKPIVFTSAEPAPAAGDWRGLVVLGNAPVGAATRIYLADPALSYGGVNADDDSGRVEFVRVEYGALGFVLAGVGRPTVIDSVEVRKPTDNCFTFAGGRVDAKHLVCQFPGDEGLETVQTYEGRIQFVFVQKAPLALAGRHGVLADGSKPRIYNATICGDSVANPNYGLVARNGTDLDVANTIFSGWTAAVDVVDAASAALEVRGSIAFANTANPAYAEDPTVVDTTSALFNDDVGFDEIAWFRAPARGNREVDPGLAACFDAVTPQPWPAAAITTGALTPPADGFFDATAAFVGAFRDGNDTWMRGAWVRFAND